MNDIDIIEIKTLSGYVKIQCQSNNTIEELIRKALNNEYNWTYFGLQIDEWKIKRTRQFICPKLLWSHAKLLFAASSFHLAFRHYPLDISAAINSSLLTIRYLKDQLKEDFPLFMPEIIDMEVGLDLSCLVYHKPLRNLLNQSSKSSTVELKNYFPSCVLDKIKAKYLKKFIQSKIAEIDVLSEADYLQRLFNSYQKCFGYDQDHFKCDYGAGEGIPLTISIGPSIDICATFGAEWRSIGYFKKIESIFVSQSSNGKCQIKIFNYNQSAEPSLILTFLDVDMADQFIHLLDAYTGYTRAKTCCPLMLSKNPNSSTKIPEIDRNRVKRLKVLDSGQFGDVYKALLKTDSNEIEVAVKLCKSECSDESRKLFVAEAEIMLGLDHPHIVQLLGISQSSQEWWLLMEFCTGGQLLSHLIEHQSDLAELDLLTLIYQLSTALAYLHQHKILHRDIAARNVLLVGDSSSLCGKLADFGKAVRLSPDCDYFQGDVQEQVPVKWAAYESLVQRIFYPSSDVWSFAVLMWEIMTRGKKPYAELANNQILPVLRENKRLPRIPDLPGTFHNLLLACWNIDVTRRPNFDTIKNKINEVKIEVKKMQAEDRSVSMISGINSKPPIKPAPYLDADSFINQSMPDLLARGNNTISNQHYQQRTKPFQSPQLRHNNQNTHSRYNNKSLVSTLPSSRAKNNDGDDDDDKLSLIAHNFKNKTEAFVQAINQSKSCSILQIKGYGLSIRHFLQELEDEIPPHPIEHELTDIERLLIKHFKSIMRLRVTRDFTAQIQSGGMAGDANIIVKMAAICDSIIEQTDCLLVVARSHARKCANYRPNTQIDSSSRLDTPSMYNFSIGSTNNEYS